jgi:hypothetical protein
MFRIRREQFEALSRTLRKSFEDRMVVHLRKFFPELCTSLGEDATRARISEGIRRAKAYRIVAERDVCRYIDLTFALGPDFDRDEALPWARQILNDPGLTDPSQKTRRLYDAARQHRRSPHGSRA